jgi:uncharacterized membrane protein YkvA (DUF1232 family)
MTTEPRVDIEQSFWDKLKKFAAQAGKEVVERALTLYYAAQRPETPLWAKAVIYSALAYFILPTDAIPDLAPIAGFTDDLGALTAALTAVALCITPEVKQEAKQKVQDWFGSDDAIGSHSNNNTRAPKEIAIE